MSETNQESDDRSGNKETNEPRNADGDLGAARARGETRRRLKWPIRAENHSIGAGHEAIRQFWDVIAQETRRAGGFTIARCGVRVTDLLQGIYRAGVETTLEAIRYGLEFEQCRFEEIGDEGEYWRCSVHSRTVRIDKGAPNECPIRVELVTAYGAGIEVGIVEADRRVREARIQGFDAGFAKAREEERAGEKKWPEKACSVSHLDNMSESSYCTTHRVTFRKDEAMVGGVGGTTMFCPAALHGIRAFREGWEAGRISGETARDSGFHLGYKKALEENARVKREKVYAYDGAIPRWWKRMVDAVCSASGDNLRGVWGAACEIYFAGREDERRMNPYKGDER